MYYIISDRSIVSEAVEFEAKQSDDEDDEKRIVDIQALFVSQCAEQYEIDTRWEKNETQWKRGKNKANTQPYTVVNEREYMLRWNT